MEKRKLGSSDIEIAPLVFGGNVFGWTIDDNKTFELLDAFVDAGFNAIDTADVYSVWVPGNKGGESETAIGKWFKKSGKRDKVVLATKVGGEMGPGQKGLGRKYIISQVETSLQRLQTDYIDLYQSHYDDLETPVEETMEAYDQLIKEGKVRIIGASNFEIPRLEEAIKFSLKHEMPSYQTFQPEFNLFDRKVFEEEIAPFTMGINLSVISYFSLASGFLTGKYRSKEDLQGSKRSGMVEKYLNDRGFRILAALDELAAEYHVTPATLSLAWLMAHPAVAAPIASATSLEQLHELTQAATITLEDAAIEKLDEASAY
ncbi:aldo/keto reductase [Dyadobacter sediminis]|uniref:Aldo/keto reductase n=1 Tax=Dyadobacter sediminis TaxID=1493691 RepID=A0A5R9KBW3_9BACT|nr:aldo/keto reductase [Dyadobacter sediminis]TLU92265.1 aldo/keto reductase [Dyadobacter sediminis]GGB96033.1 oxidoreductase [Dyadobacter sediminis]